MDRVALTVAYDGRPYNGWQTQPDGKAVQDYLQQALARIAGEPVRVVCAGRTDTGVHALAQTVHFDPPVQRPASAWLRGTNSHLPDSIAVQAVHAVRPDFHARFDATERQYQYLLRVAPTPEPYWSGRAGWSFRPVDVARMRAAAQCLAGEHDFSAFRSSQCQAASPVRTMQPVQITGSAGLICLTFTANAFLHHMIRNLVGALVMIGQSRRPVEWMAQLLAGRDRTVAAPTFAPHGLYFCGARYRPEDGLPPYRRIDGIGFQPGAADDVQEQE